LKGQLGEWHEIKDKKVFSTILKMQLKMKAKHFLNKIGILIVKCNVIHLQKYQVKSATSALPLFKTLQTLIIVSS
jgi:hypothetical protein